MRLISGKLFGVPIEADGNSGAIEELQLDRAIDHPGGMRELGSDSLLVVESGGKGDCRASRFGNTERS